MSCPQCGTENPEGARFCFHCGSKLAAVCPQCDATLPPQGRFCPHCGAQVSAPSVEAPIDQELAVARTLERLVPREYAERLLATRGQARRERRMVTILFSDVKGSTAMADQLDPEEWAEIMDGAFVFLNEPVYRFEGTVAHLIGDAVLAFFGAPIAHEDDAQRAVLAALEITAGSRRYAERLEQERGIQGFDVRVGINTGLVVVGEVGSDLRMQYTAMGDAVNLAARMEQHAPPGGILISHDTYRHVRGVFDVLPQEPLAVKGKVEPVQTYLVRRAKTRAFRLQTRGVQGIETRMVGREPELLSLQNAYREAAGAAESQVVTVVGEAGVGKSRLLYEFHNWLDLLPEGIWYFRGQGAALTQAVPYSLWRDLFAHRFEILESDSAAAALSKFREGMGGGLEPERADLVGQLVGFEFSASPAVAALLGSPSFGPLATAYLARYLRALLAEGPMVILLEDLHWADDSSLELVDRLVAEIPNASLLILAAARPELFERRASWGDGFAKHTRLDLRPLSRQASRALVSEILRLASEVPESVGELVVEGAEGNPFYVEELVKMLIEDGVIVTGEDAWQIRPERLAEVQVPPTLTGVLQARLDGLPLEEKAVLQRAAVVGRDFWDRLVGELAADTLDGGAVRPWLSSLRGRELIFRRERSSIAMTDEYTFKHAMLRDVTYETVLLRLRRRYHGQVAAWLESNAGERLGEYLSLIAGHYELAGEAARAAGYLERSGDELYKVAAYRDAARAFERASALIDLAAPLPAHALAGVGAMAAGGERAALLVKLGRALTALSDYGAARERLAEGLALARAGRERGTEALALAVLGEIELRQVDFDAAGERLKQAQALAHGCGDPVAEALALRQLAGVALQRGEWEPSIHWAEQSRVLCGRLGDRLGEAAALNVLGCVAWRRGEFDKARRHFETFLAVAREVGERRGMSVALGNLGAMALEQEAFEEARGFTEQALGIMEEIGDRRGLAVALGNLAEMCLDQGQDSDAWRYAHASLEQCVAVGDRWMSLYNLTHVARLWARTGQHTQAAELLGLALRHSAVDMTIEQTAEKLLENLRQPLVPEELETALARGAKMDLDQVVAEILAEPPPGEGDLS